MITVENYFFNRYIEKSLAEVIASQVTTGTEFGRFQNFGLPVLTGFNNDNILLAY